MLLSAKLSLEKDAFSISSTEEIHTSKCITFILLRETLDVAHPLIGSKVMGSIPGPNCVIVKDDKVVHTSAMSDVRH